MRRSPIFVIFLFVVLFHAGALLWIMGFATSPKEAVPKSRMVARTVSLVEKPSFSSARNLQPSAVKSSSKAPSPPKKEEATKKNAQTNPKPVKKQAQSEPKMSAATKKKEPVQEGSDRKRQLLAKAGAEMAKAFSGGVKGSNKEGENLLEVGSLEIAMGGTLFDAAAIDDGYYHALVAFLQKKLRLPEKGDVKVLLTLDRAGSVLRVKTTASQSAVNQKFLESEIPRLQFPAFGNFFEGEKEKTFTLSLTSDR